MTPFDTLTEKDAAALIVVPDGYIDNRAMYSGDMWGKGDARFWIGPRPAAGDADAATTLTEIERALISKNVIAEVVGRHTGGAIGREPDWSFGVERELADGEQPNPAEQALIDEAESLLTSVWDERGLLAMLQDAVATLLLAGRAPLRLYVPSGLLTEQGTIPPGDLAQSMALIYADPAPSPEVATVAEDAKTRQPVGVYSVTEGKEKITELVYRDGDDTVLRRADKEEAAFRFDYGGRLPMYEMRRPQFVTPQVRQQQMLINLALTMLGRNVVLGGFLERILLNAQLPGSYTGEGAARRFVPDAFRVGAGTTNVLAGIPIRNEGGEITDYTSPSVVYRDPVPTTTFAETKDLAYRGILEETQQMHALIAGLFNVSGESRIQARADFLMSLSDTKTQIEQAGRWLLETWLAMASAFAGQAGRFNTLRATFSCRLDAGPIGADAMGATRENVVAGLLSTETAMARIGVEDTAAELAKIASQKEQSAVIERDNATSILGRAGILAQGARGVSNGT